MNDFQARATAYLAKRGYTVLGPLNGKIMVRDPIHGYIGKKYAVVGYHNVPLSDWDQVFKFESER